MRSDVSLNNNRTARRIRINRVKLPANPARGQLNREMNISLFALEGAYCLPKYGK